MADDIEDPELAAELAMLMVDFAAVLMCNIVAN